MIYCLLIIELTYHILLKTIAQLINWTTDYNLWTQFQVPVTLALGMINQCVGKTYEAIEYYKQVEKVFFFYFI